MELALFTHPSFFSNEAEILSQLLKNNYFTLHLRKPDATEKEYRKLLDDIPSALHNKIVVHNAFKLQEMFKLKGVHLSTKNRQYVESISNLEVISTSCHSVDEIDSISSRFTHCFLSPVFPSISKPGYDDVINKKELKLFLQNRSKLKFIALGGINIKHINEVEKLGFDGCAVLGAVWGNPLGEINNIKTNFEKIYNCVINGHIA